MALQEKWDSLNQEARERKRGPQQEIRDDLTLASISGDREKSELFSEFLKEKGADDLAEGFAKGELEGQAMVTLAEKRNEFQEIIERAAHLKEMISAHSDHFIATNQNLETMARSLGKENMLALYGEELDRAAITDPARCKRLEDELETIAASQEKITKSMEDAEALLETLNKEGTSEYEERFAKALGARDPQKALEQLIRERFWYRSGPWLRFTLKKKMKGIGEARNLKMHSETLEEKREIFGGLMQEMIAENDRFREGALRYMTGQERERPRPEVSFNEGRSAYKNVVSDPEAIRAQYQKDLDTAKKEHANTHTSGTPAFDETDFLDNWIQSEGARRAKVKKGKKENWIQSFFKDLMLGSIEDTLKVFKNP